MCLQVITPEAWAPVKLLIMWGSCIFVQFVIFVTLFQFNFCNCNVLWKWMTIERKKWERKKGLWQKDIMEF